jgi:uncharacterized protein (DUF58 family)
MIPRDILRKVKRLEISTRHLVNDVFSGQYHSVFKGRGMEFNEVRQYQPGDDIRTIDWNVTARTGEPYVKRYVEERDLTVMLLVDLSRSQAFGTRSQRKSEVAAELCALLAFVAIRNQDRVGFLAFTDQVERFIPPAKGRRHGLRVIREVLAASPAGVRTDVGVALEHVGRVLKHRAVVFVISDFIAPDFRTSFRTAAKRHDVVGMRLVDPRERELPALGLCLVEHLETGERLWVDLGRRAVRTAYEREAQARAERVRRLFTASGSDLIEIPVEADGAYVGPLIQFFRRRAARVRQGR